MVVWRLVFQCPFNHNQKDTPTCALCMDLESYHSMSPSTHLSCQHHHHYHHHLQWSYLRTQETLSNGCQEQLLRDASVISTHTPKYLPTPPTGKISTVCSETCTHMASPPFSVLIAAPEEAHWWVLSSQTRPFSASLSLVPQQSLGWDKRQSRNHRFSLLPTYVQLQGVTMVFHTI